MGIPDLCQESLGVALEGSTNRSWAGRWLLPAGGPPLLAGSWAWWASGWDGLLQSGAEVRCLSASSHTNGLCGPRRSALQSPCLMLNRCEMFLETAQQLSTVMEPPHLQAAKCEPWFHILTQTGLSASVSCGCFTNYHKLSDLKQHRSLC